MTGLFRSFAIALCLLTVSGCALGLGFGEEPSQVLPVFVGATNESGLERRIELRINGVVVVDTIVGPPRSLAGDVLADTVRLAPGEHALVLVDHANDQQHQAHLVARPEPMFIVIRLLAGRTVFETGYGILEFM